MVWSSCWAPTLGVLRGFSASVPGEEVTSGEGTEAPGCPQVFRQEKGLLAHQCKGPGVGSPSPENRSVSSHGPQGEESARAWP